MMAQEKAFENKVKKFLKEENCWFIKYWAGAAFTKEGIPDILCCCNGYFLAIELKAPNGKPSDLQIYNINKINETGGFAIILYPKDFDLFEEMVEYLQFYETSEASNLVEIINERWC